jgi:hypothetical protein
MRVYVAAPLKEHLLAEYCATLMALHGAHIVSSWHSDVTSSLQPGVDPPIDPAPNTLAGMTARTRIATKCLDEVGMLNPVIDKFVCVFTDRPARGTYVELGAALARGVSVVLLNRTSEGASARHSVFDSHALVRVVYDVREMLEAVFYPLPLLDDPDTREAMPTEPDAESLPPPEGDP